MTCNGHLEPEIAKVGQLYEQPVQLFWNTGERPGFEEVKPAQAGADLFQPQVGRGCAFADIDGDGTPDVVLTSNGGPARLLRNEGGSGNHWIRLVLEGDGVRSNRSAIGARVVLKAGGQVAAARSARRPRLPEPERAARDVRARKGHAHREPITMYWPGKHGGKEEWTGLEIDRSHTIRQGKAGR